MLPPRKWSAALAAVVLAISASSAWALGELSQKPGSAGCFGGPPADGCAPGRALKEASDVAVSPDGRNVYVAARGDSAVAIFDRDPSTGALTQKPGVAGCVAKDESSGCEQVRSVGAVEGVVVSPDGKNVYVAARGSGAVAIFDRDSSTGALTQKPGIDGCISQPAGSCQPGRALDGPGKIDISRDGTSVYVVSFGAVAIFDRDSEGRLTQKPGAAGCLAVGGTDGKGNACVPGRGLGFRQDVALSPDGKQVYVVSSTPVAIAILDREPGGALSQDPGERGCISQGGVAACQPTQAFVEAPDGVAVSPDSRNVYVGLGGGVRVFDRDPAGRLIQKPGIDGCLSTTERPDCGRLRSGASSFSVAPNGESVYATAGTAGLAVLDRDPGGRLTQKPGMAGCLAKDGSEGCQIGRGIPETFSVATSPDGRNVYVASFEPGALAVFDRAVPPPPPVDVTAPAISAFRFAPARFRVGAKRGTHIRFTLSERSSVQIAIERIRPGRRVGKRCKAPRPKLDRHRVCRRLLPAGGLEFDDRPAGANDIRFSGRVGRRLLRAGFYRATIVATDAAGNRSAPRHARFTTLPPPRSR
jgi:DNA-binding beta-propeller fold protein YncE